MTSFKFDLDSGAAAAENLFLSRLTIKNYKSIASASIDLGPLIFFVGPNGSGKSNVLDAIAFVRDALARPLDHALKDRGGINEVRRRSSGHPKNFGLRLDFSLPSGQRGFYAFEIAARPASGYVIKSEECRISGPAGSHFFRIESGAIIQISLSTTPTATQDRLFLLNVSGTNEFRDTYDALSTMQVYNINPDSVKALQPPSAEPILTRDGNNITTIYGSITKDVPATKNMIESYLGAVVPGVRSVGIANLGPVETLEFRQDVQGATAPWSFLAQNMSDGTLRVFGLLVALFQSQDLQAPILPVIGIEEPEISLHPAALRLILESLYEASKKRQVLVTSHSPELLDDPKLEADWIRAVVSSKNATAVVPISQNTRDILRDGLYSPGELLRLNQIEPDEEAIKQQDSQMKLFS